MSNACTTVGSGGVGESGSFQVLSHMVTGQTSKIIKLVTTQSSLCPNTGAAGQIMVNDQSVAHGDITGVQNSLQAEVQPNDRVTAIINSYPRFNGVVCFRLGELSAELQQCDLVATTHAAGGGPTPTTSAPQTRGWYAWNNKMPPRPDDFHIEGEVLVANPGVEVALHRREPQGINPQILQLTLTCTQRPGIWPHVMTWQEVRYDKVLVDSSFDSVELFWDQTSFQTVPVDTVH